MTSTRCDPVPLERVVREAARSTPGQVVPGRDPCRADTEQNSCHHGGDKCEGQHRRGRPRGDGDIVDPLQCHRNHGAGENIRRPHRSDAAEQRQQNARYHGLLQQLPAAGAQRHADRDLLALRHRLYQQQIGHVGADDQHHEARCRHQQLERLLVIHPDDVDARLGGGNLRPLPLDLRPLVRMHLRAAAAQPLAEFGIQLRIDLGMVGARRNTADDVQPVAVRPGVERALVHEVRFLPQRNPQLRHVGVDGLAHESGRRDADDGGRRAVHHQRLADDMRVARKAALPHAIA